jgi:hypothetical protein
MGVPPGDDASDVVEVTLEPDAEGVVALDRAELLHGDAAERPDQICSRVLSENAHDGRAQGGAGDAQVDRLVVVDLEALVLRQQQHGSRYPIAQKGGEQSGAGEAGKDVVRGIRGSTIERECGSTLVVCHPTPPTWRCLRVANDHGRVERTERVP